MEPPETKLTRTKRLWAEQGRFLTGDEARAPRKRLPPGQHLVTGWPVLDLGIQPEIARDDWRLVIGGRVANRVVWDWDTLQRQPQSAMRSDIHCVTSWSRYDNDWEGVATRDLIERVRPHDDARFVALEGSDGYTTNLPIDDCADAQALLAHSWQGAAIGRAHGGPVRLIVPHLYFWKSAKWLRRITFLTEDEPGFWEENGYHIRGDPWAEQRYSTD